MKAVPISMRAARRKLNKSDHGDDDIGSLMKDDLPMTTKAKFPTTSNWAMGLRLYFFFFATVLGLLQFYTLTSVCDIQREELPTTTWTDHPTAKTDTRKLHDDDNNNNTSQGATSTATNDGE